MSVRIVLFQTQLILQIQGFHLRSLQIRCSHSARCICPASQLAPREGHMKFRALAWSPYRRKPIEILRRTALSQNTYYRTPLGAIARSGHLSLSSTVESKSSEMLHQSSLIIIASGGDFTKNKLCTNVRFRSLAALQPYTSLMSAFERIADYLIPDFRPAIPECLLSPRAVIRSDRNKMSSGAAFGQVRTFKRSDQ